jgi:hypothetical protein
MIRALIPALAIAFAASFFAPVAPAEAGDLKAKCVAVNEADTTADEALRAQAESGCSCFAEGVAAGKADAGLASSALDHAAVADRLAVVETDANLKTLVEACWQL